MKTQNTNIVLLSLCLATASFTQVEAASCNHVEQVKTDAGHLEFPTVQNVKHAAVFHQVKHLNIKDGVIELENGSRWTISKPEAIKGWEKSKHLVVTQNHSNFSTSRYALANLDLKLAEPISLAREPTPNKEINFVKSVDKVNDIIMLSNGKKWIVHSADREKLGNISENDRVIIGVNTGNDKDKSPYLLIDTANNHFVRAHIIE